LKSSWEIAQERLRAEPSRSGDHPEDPSSEPKQDALSSAGEVATLQRKAAERDEYLGRLQRALADLQNYQKRIEREREQWSEQALRNFAGDLLITLDAIEAAISQQEGSTQPPSLQEGIRIARDHLLHAFRRHRIEPIPAVGEPFDPAWHEASGQEIRPELPEGQICRELQRGYRIGDFSLRPARVIIAARPPASADPPPAAPEQKAVDAPVTPS
jgi:molecular chaperone GrpE